MPLSILASTLCTPFVLLGCAGGGDQPPPEAAPAVPRVEATLPAVFAQLSNVVELGDGRVAFADTRQRLFLFADLATGKIDTIGVRVDTLGRNPPTVGEYRLPGHVVRLAGDTVAMVDFAALRTTLWTQTGGYIGVLPLPLVGGLTPTLAYDHLGHGYKADFRAVLGGQEPGERVRRDSLPILRFTAGTQRVDTVAWLAGPDYGQAKFGDQVQEVAVIFGPTDTFGVLADGSLWVARGHQNRVDWRAPDGTWTLGTPRERAKVPVTQADKDRFMQRMQERGMPTQVGITFPFAENRPPFEGGLASPAGEVWLQRPRPDESGPLTYDVHARNGGWKRAVTLPAGASLAGFGRDGAIYATLKEGEGRKVARLRE